MKTILKNFLFAALLLPALTIGITGCEDDDDGVEPKGNPIDTIPNDTLDTIPKNFRATIYMKQVVNGITLMMNTANKPYTNASGQDYSVSRLQYLISDLTFNKVGGESTTIEGYHYVDLDDTTTLTYSPATKIPEGDYESISFTFGFDEQDNVDNAYSELNVLNWNWPGMLGGGYHFMRLEGDYDSLGTSKIFRTHMGTARNNTVTPTTFEANHFDVVLTNSAFTADADFSFDLEMDVAQWYEDTYQWDFNVYNAPIMPIYDAQKKLNENGPTVFSIANIQ